MARMRIGFLKRAEIFLRRAFLSLLARRSHSAAELPLRLSPNPKILLLRQDRIGDVIISTPLMMALQKHYPNAEISILLSKNNSVVFPLLPIECTAYIYRKNLLNDVPLLRSLRKKHFDVCIDLMDNPSVTSSILASAIAARYTVGIAKQNASVYNVLVPCLDRGKIHIARRILQLVEPFGIDPDTIDIQPKLALSRRQQVSGLIGVNISAGTLAGKIPPTVFADICRSLAESDGVVEVKVFAQPADVVILNRVVSLADLPAVTASPVVASFSEFAAQLSECEYICSPDTSVIHLASALGIPVIGLYEQWPPTLHHWTPLGVQFEMIVKKDLRLITGAEIRDAFEALRSKVHPVHVAEEAV